MLAIHHWDQENKQWAREKDENSNYREVVLKVLNNSQDNTKFLYEIDNHKSIDDWFNNIVPCYGISQNLEDNYIIVMQYMPEGNLRKYLGKNNKELKEKLAQKEEISLEIKLIKGKTPQNKEILEKKQQELTKLDLEISNLQIKLGLQSKFNQLVNISQGLKDIHQKYLVHKDFHSGNILKGIEQTTCLITDFGLVNEGDEIFGVLPYVAPEVLQGQPYTQAADIYSFSIIAYELFSGLPPYYDRVHDVNLGIAICQGLRPQFQIKIPALLEDLIKKCWDTTPTKRPTANDLEKTLRNWVQKPQKQEKKYYFSDSEDENMSESEEDDWSLPPVSKMVKINRMALEEKEDDQLVNRFARQLQKAEEFNKSLPNDVKFPNYQIHHGTVYHSKLLPTKEITQLMQNFNLLNKTSELNTQWLKVKELAEKVKNAEQEEEFSHKNSDKYKEFKKALKIALETSQKLEQIIAFHPLISDDAKEILKKVKESREKLQVKTNAYQKLIEKKQQTLEELKITYLEKSGNYKKDKLQKKLTKLLKFQVDIINYNAPSAIEEKEEIKEELVKETSITTEELINLCQLQTEITQLELELKKDLNQQTKQLTQIVNNINSISIQQGTAIIGSTIGNQANFSYNTTNKLDLHNKGLDEIGSSVTENDKGITDFITNPIEEISQEQLDSPKKVEEQSEIKNSEVNESSKELASNLFKEEQKKLEDKKSELKKLKTDYIESQANRDKKEVTEKLEKLLTIGKKVSDEDKNKIKKYLSSRSKFDSKKLDKILKLQEEIKLEIRSLKEQQLQSQIQVDPK